MGCAGRRGLSKRKIAIWVPRAEIRADTPARGPLSLAQLYHTRAHLSIVNFNKKKSEFSFALHLLEALAARCHTLGAFFAPLARTENLLSRLDRNITFMKPSHNSFTVSLFSGFRFNDVGLCIDFYNPVFHVTSPVLPVRARRSALH